MHLCEKYGEINQCLFPGHVVIGTKRENVQHANTLRVAAGVPLPQTGRRLSNDAKARIGAAHLGLLHSAATKTRIGNSRRGQTQLRVLCPGCGHLIAQGHLTRHKCGSRRFPL
jgi:hypothetical protein